MHAENKRFGDRDAERVGPYQIANSSAEGRIRIGPHLSRTDRALADPVSPQPINAQHSRDAGVRDQWTLRVWLGRLLRTSCVNFMCCEQAFALTCFTNHPRRHRSPYRRLHGPPRPTSCPDYGQPPVLAGINPTDYRIWSVMRERAYQVATIYALVATELDQLTASSSASCRIVRPPSNLVNGHECTIWSMVWGRPPSRIFFWKIYPAELKYGWYSD